MIRRIAWIAVFGGLLTRAIQRVGRVRPPEGEERPPQWRPLDFS